MILHLRTTNCNIHSCTNLSFVSFFVFFSFIKTKLKCCQGLKITENLQPTFIHTKMINISLQKKERNHQIKKKSSYVLCPPSHKHSHINLTLEFLSKLMFFKDNSSTPVGQAESSIHWHSTINIIHNTHVHIL